MVVAKHDAAHQNLSEQFADHGREGNLARSYLALVWGDVERPAGTIEAALDRSRSNRQKMTVVGEAQGRYAITHYEVLERFADDKGKVLASLLACHLETGRTHQIRVHMAHIRHPVMGDETYGTGFKASARNLPAAAQQALAALQRQALHAALLGFDHPKRGEYMEFETDPPADMQALIDALRGEVAQEVEEDW
jgi:23S rRNA pseudouridine1911/1915/1917 synthase